MNLCSEDSTGLCAQSDFFHAHFLHFYARDFFLNFNIIAAACSLALNVGLTLPLVSSCFRILEAAEKPPDSSSVLPGVNESQRKPNKTALAKLEFASSAESEAAGQRREERLARSMSGCPEGAMED